MKNRCNINNMELNTGYYMQLPKVLFSKEFKNVNSDAKIVYALLKDRYQISAYKKFTNKQGDIVVIYPREKIAEKLNISIPTVRKAIKKLSDMGLIEEERQGLNKPNLIYLLKLEKTELADDDWDIDYGIMYDDIHFDTETADKELEENEITLDSHIAAGIIEDEKIINFQEIQDISDSKNLSLQEVKNKYFYAKRENILLSGEKKSFTPEEKNVSPSIINKSLINISLNNLSNQSYYDVIDKIKTQIDYAVICKDNEKELNLIVDVMADVYLSDRDIVVGKILKPISHIKARLESLNQFHIQYVMECLEDCKTGIRNIKQYILTALFNAPSTMEFYYCNKIKTMLG